MRDALKRRRNGPADKLITDGRPCKKLRDYFVKNLDLDVRQMFTTTRIDFSYVDELAEKMPEDLTSVPGFDPLPPESAIGPGTDPLLARARASNKRQFLPEPEIHHLLH